VVIFALGTAFVTMRFRFELSKVTESSSESDSESTIFSAFIGSFCFDPLLSIVSWYPTEYCFFSHWKIREIED